MARPRRLDSQVCVRRSAFYRVGAACADRREPGRAWVRCRGTDVMRILHSLQTGLDATLPLPTVPKRCCGRVSMCRVRCRLHRTNPKPSPGTDAAGLSPVPVRMWRGRAQSRYRCGRANPTALCSSPCRSKSAQTARRQSAQHARGSTRRHARGSARTRQVRVVRRVLEPDPRLVELRVRTAAPARARSSAPCWVWSREYWFVLRRYINITNVRKVF